MATVNLGRIKPVFRGAYSGSTAYVVDDIVTSGGSSYICIQAHGAGTQAVNQTAYWTQMAAGGTDVGTTITTQGDILYRDGSGLQRLGAGTSGNVLTTKGSGQNPVWEPASGGKVLQFKHVIDATNRTTTSASYTQAGSGLQLSITPSATSSKIFMLCGFTGGLNGSSARANYSFHRDISGGAQNTELAYGSAGFMTHEVNSVYMAENPISFNYVDSPNTTSAITYYTVMKAQAGNTAYMSNSSATGHFFLMELDGS